MRKCLEGAITGKQCAFLSQPCHRSSVLRKVGHPGHSTLKARKEGVFCTYARRKTGLALRVCANLQTASRRIQQTKEGRPGLHAVLQAAFCAVALCAWCRFASQRPSSLFASTLLTTRSAGERPTCWLLKCKTSIETSLSSREVILPAQETLWADKHNLLGCTSELFLQVVGKLEPVLLPD